VHGVLVVQCGYEMWYMLGYTGSSI